MNDDQGQVDLIGSGPGDPDLITVKAVRALERADIVFHDKLSPDPLIDRYCDSNVSVRDVGKRKGKVGPSQTDINEALVEAANTHNHVVRLKGGDPYLFGRGSEEATYLEQHNVHFQVIPGVSSLLAVPNYAGVPATRRKQSSSMAVFTGHLGSGQTELPWTSLADIDTLVVMMGITRANRIARKLIEAGREPQTPVAVIGWGTTARQHSTKMTLNDLTDGLTREQLYLPGLIVIGEVVEDRNQLNWFESKPLFGKRIVVTRPAHQNQGMADQLREAGAHPLKAPTISINPRAQGIEELERQWSSFDQYDWLVFTSRNGVRLFFEALRDANHDARLLGSLRLAAIGTGTAEELSAHGLNTDLIPDDYRAEALGADLLEKLNKPSNVLLPRAAGARRVLPERLREHGHSVTEIATYESVPAEESKPQFNGWISDDEVDMITFTSASTVDSLFRMFDGDENRLRSWLADRAIGTIGPITAERLKDRGLSVDVIPDQYTIDDFVEAIRDYYGNKPVPQTKESS